jgi:ribonuclease HI
MIRVYTDGACSHGNGGWGWYAPDAGFRMDSGAVLNTTNNRMELWAAIEAFRAFPSDTDIEIVSDSAYVVNCMKDRWYDRWRVNGWRNSKKQPVENRDLWEDLLALVEARSGNVTWTHIRGHNGDPGNEMADRLAVEARLSLVDA